MATKTCTKCKLCKELAEFSPRSKSSDGVNSWCKICVAEQTRGYNAERMRDRRKNLDYSMKERKQQAEYRKLNKPLIDALKRTSTIKRRNTQAQATPAWVDIEFERFVFSEAFALAALRKSMFGFSWHVDHVIPLNGTNVSGLHVSNNVQVIPAYANLQKSNKFLVESVV